MTRRADRTVPAAPTPSGDARPAAEAGASLVVEALHAGYGGAEVLRGIGFELAAGEIVALLGANGAGKTTAINTVCGLLAASAGRVLLEGERIDGRRSAEIVARGLVQVPEGRCIFPNLTVAENLDLGAYRRGGRNRARNLAAVLALFPRLAERMGQKAGTMSGGEQQMLAIGRALMAEPRVLILDEPSLGLSPRMVDELFALIRRLHDSGLAILLVEQNVAQSLAVAQRAYVLENGAIGFAGTPAELLASPALRKAYLGL